VSGLKKLKDKNITVYTIAGATISHLLERQCLKCLKSRTRNKCLQRRDSGRRKLKLEFTIDKKTGTKITGMIGKKGCSRENIMRDYKAEP